MSTSPRDFSRLQSILSYENLKTYIKLALAKTATGVCECKSWVRIPAREKFKEEIEFAWGILQKSIENHEKAMKTYAQFWFPIKNNDSV